MKAGRAPLVARHFRAARLARRGVFPRDARSQGASRQATLHQLGKVVTSRSSSYYNVSVEDVLRHKKTLEDREHTTQAEFVEALRQLSSMTLTHEVLSESLIGQVVNRVARKHPDPELREMGASIVKKWKAEVVARERRKKHQGWTRGGGASSREGESGVRRGEASECAPTRGRVNTHPRRSATRRRGRRRVMTDPPTRAPPRRQLCFARHRFSDIFAPATI